MDITDMIALFGGLVLFLYGMHQMSDGIKENASGTLKILLEKVTNNLFKSFLLGIFVTAIIQSSSATIAITAGLVAAGILTLHQSLGIIAGANVGTTITSQIIRLMEVDSSSGILSFFSPKTLAPLALIIGYLLLQGKKLKNGKVIGNILIGFGILFTGLLSMTEAVTVLTKQGFFDGIFSFLNNPLFAYLTGAAIALVLRGSASVGVLQTLSMSGGLSFHVVLTCLLGIYLGDSSASYLTLRKRGRADEKRVAVIHVLYNLSKSLLIVLGISLYYAFINRSFYQSTADPGSIANMHTAFNLIAAVLLFAVMPLLEKISRNIVKDDPLPVYKYAEKIDALNTRFIATPALALNACYEALLTIYDSSLIYLHKAYTLIRHYDEKTAEEIRTEEKEVAVLADALSVYMGEISSFVEADLQVSILNNYYRVMGDFVRLYRAPKKLSSNAKTLHDSSNKLSPEAFKDLKSFEEILEELLADAGEAFRLRDLEAAERVEPLSEVMKEAYEGLIERHMERLKKGICVTASGIEYQKILSHLMDLRSSLSRIALETVCRIKEEVREDPHSYLRDLHAGKDEGYNEKYRRYKEKYLSEKEG